MIQRLVERGREGEMLSSITCWKSASSGHVSQSRETWGGKEGKEGGVQWLLLTESLSIDLVTEQWIRRRRWAQDQKRWGGKGDGKVQMWGGRVRQEMGEIWLRGLKRGAEEVKGWTKCQVHSKTPSMSGFYGVFVWQKWNVMFVSPLMSSIYHRPAVRLTQ